MAAVRYIVSDIPRSVAFYRDVLGFEVEMEADGFAALSRDDLRLFLNIPGAGSAGKAGGNPEPGGWNRFQIETGDLDSLIDRLRSADARFHGDVAEGPGGRQILLEDPSGNVIELFEHAKQHA
jgi:catechol 2,3-dioxygenase-like lactoylglutathione lyase family enzyme